VQARPQESFFLKKKLVTLEPEMASNRRVYGGSMGWGQEYMEAVSSEKRFFESLSDLEKDYYEKNKTYDENHRNFISGVYPYYNDLTVPCDLFIKEHMSRKEYHKD
jgi:hypothetical protein